MNTINKDNQTINLKDIVYHEMEGVYSNKIEIGEVSQSNAANLKVFKKTFTQDVDYVNKPIIELKVAQYLNAIGVYTPDILFTGDNFIISRYIEKEALPSNILNVISKELVKIHTTSVVDDKYTSLISEVDLSVRNYSLRSKQILCWLNQVDSELGGLSSREYNLIDRMLIQRDNYLTQYSLTLRDCGKLNTILSNKHVYLTDFERSSHALFTDDIASLMLEDSNKQESIVSDYTKSITKTSSILTDFCRSEQFKTELFSSLFEKTLEIAAYFTKRYKESKKMEDKTIYSKHLYSLDSQLKKLMIEAK